MNESLLEDFFKGDTRALARVITRVENRAADSMEILQQLVFHTQLLLIVGAPKDKVPILCLDYMQVIIKLQLPMQMAVQQMQILQ